VDATICSFEVGFQKPNPRIFEIALERVGARAAQSVMIGDDEINDCEAPPSLGIKSRLAEPGAQDGGASLKRVLTRVLSKAKAKA
jgi:FMN phosphatase YigB (HAD superfamily)